MRPGGRASAAPTSFTFQSTHPRGVRRGLRVRGPYSEVNFNPRTHVGCDLMSKGLGKSFVISIHAPTWGATVSALSLRQRNWISIHAPTWGATTKSTMIGTEIAISIHAPTWGATCLSGGVQGVFEISIHAPTWGATRGRQYGEQVFGISIHAPTWGATKTNHRPGRGVQFQSTHPRGVRR